MRILHLTTDNKFFPMAIRSFERVYPGKNTTWVKSCSYDGNYGSTSFDREISNIDLISPSVIKEINNNYDYIVLHSFESFWLPLITLISNQNKVFWLGWGYDYYDLVFSEKDLILDETKKIVECERGLLPIVKDYIRKKWKSLLIHKFQSISTVIKNEHDLISKLTSNNYLPKYKSWNYGELKEDYVKSVLGKKVNGTNILVGNSSSPTNNHLEVIEFLSSQKVEFKIIVPLNYGDANYKNNLSNKLDDFRDLNIQVLHQFIKPEDYSILLQSCGNVIMNHVRQQAVGNIIIGLYLGARVFLRKENPVYEFLCENGFVISSIEELLEAPSLLNEPLNEIEVENNINGLERFWSLEAIDNNTQSLFY